MLEMTLLYIFRYTNVHTTDRVNARHIQQMIHGTLLVNDLVTDTLLV
jgi:hypothetical protein